MKVGCGCGIMRFNVSASGGAGVKKAKGRAMVLSGKLWGAMHVQGKAEARAQGINGKKWARSKLSTQLKVGEPWHIREGGGSPPFFSSSWTPIHLSSFKPGRFNQPSHSASSLFFCPPNLDPP